ncbi:MAG: hypothetical protein DSM106950_17900 [Stigonema ocellatum SAG 48.90 = DSM 106950]|nr:hypothetical protein [Stigonema ocellatum SAG 48.90 = DSM 106950]
MPGACIERQTVPNAVLTLSCNRFDQEQQRYSLSCNRFAQKQQSYNLLIQKLKTILRQSKRISIPFGKKGNDHDEHHIEE